MKYEKTIKVLDEKGVKIPKFLLDCSDDKYNVKNIGLKNLEEVKKILDKRNPKLNNYFLGISTNKMNWLCNWVEKNIVPYLKTVYGTQCNGRVINLPLEIIEFRKIHEYCFDMDETWIADILLCAKKVDEGFFFNIMKAKSYGLWDIDNYYGKCKEVFSIYLDSDDLIYISITKEENKTDKIYLSHEVGHAYYNYINKKQVETFDDFIDTEYEAIKFSILCMLNESEEIFEEFISNILSDICLKLTNIYLSMELAKDKYNIDKITKKYFNIILRITPWLVDIDDYKKSSMKYNWMNIVLIDELDEYNVYYLISEIRALFWGVEKNFICNINFGGENICEIITKINTLF